MYILGRKDWAGWGQEDFAGCDGRVYSRGLMGNLPLENLMKFDTEDAAFEWLNGHREFRRYGASYFAEEIKEGSK